MAQIRSKQIADFLSSVNWASVNSTDIANAADIKALVSSEIAAVNGDNSAVSDALVAEISSTNSDFVRVEDYLSAEIYDARLYTSNEMDRATTAEFEINQSVDSLEVALSAEISATNSDFVRVEAAYAAADSIEKARAEGAEGVLDGKISTEKGRIDAILLASDADKDSFAEIVSLINGVDTSNDNAFAGYVLSNNASVDSLELAITGDFNSIDTRSLDLENALSAEISATNADVTSIDLAIAAEHSHHTAAEVSLENALSAEISATNSDFVRVEANLTNEIESLTTYVIDEVTSIDNAASALSTEVVNEVASIDTRLGSVSGDLVSSVDSLEVALTAEISATNSDFVVVNSSIDSLEVALTAEISATNADFVVVNSSIDSLEVALTAEISATNADFTSVNTRVSTEEARVDAILLASDADKDSFAEIVSLINQVDTTNDEAFAGYALATDASIDSLELAIAGDFTSIDDRATNIELGLVDIIGAANAYSLATDASVDSLEVALSAEISATNDDFTSLEGVVSVADSIEKARAIAAEGSLETSVGSLETAHDARLDSLEGYIMEDAQELTENFVGAGYSYTLSNNVQDGNKYLVKAYVNGVFVEVTSVVGAIATVSTSYAIDGDDNVTFTYQF